MTKRTIGSNKRTRVAAPKKGAPRRPPEDPQVVVATPKPRPPAPSSTGIISRIKGIQEGPVKRPYGSMLKPIKVGKRVIEPELK